MVELKTELVHNFKTLSERKREIKCMELVPLAGVRVALGSKKVMNLWEEDASSLSTTHPSPHIEGSPCGAINGCKMHLSKCVMCPFSPFSPV